jgi:hypothetical protein
MVTSFCFGTQVVHTSPVFVYPGLPGTLRSNQELRRTQRTARPCAPLCGQIFPRVPKYDLYAPSARRFFLRPIFLVLLVPGF